MKTTVKNTVPSIISIADLTRAGNVTALIGAMKSNAGKFIRVRWTRKAKVYKGAPDIYKTVSALVRCGIEYDNTKAVQQNRENGFIPSEPQPLPWGQWYEFPYIIKHKGKYYIRLYPCLYNTQSNGEIVSRPRVRTVWHCNGKPVQKNDILEHLQASERTESNPLTFTVSLENITVFGKYK